MAVADAPTDLVATPTTESVSIAFEQETADPVVTNYEVKIGDGEWEALDPAVDESPVVIEDLTNNTFYSVMLRAVNLDGESDPSDPVEFYTLDDPADNKDGFNLPTVFANAGKSTGNLDWNDPDD